MIIEQIVGNIAEVDLAGRHLEKVYVHSDDLVKRVQRMSTDHGNELGIRLREAKDLKQGDILYIDDRNAIVIQVLEDELLTIKPISLQQMGEIAHQLGNRHLPAQFTETEMLVQYDYLVEELLQHLGIPYSREKRQVREAFRHIGHHHG